MRVLRIADVINNRAGGMSRAMYFTGDILRVRGHEVDYLFSEDLMLQSRVPRRFALPLLIPHLVRDLRRQGRHYDVVEIHEPSAAAYCRQRRTGGDLPPVVVFSHGLEERGHQAELTYRQRKGLPVSLKKRFSPLTVTLQAAYAARHADHVLCCNNADLEYLAERGVPRERLTQHHNGADPEFLAAGNAPVAHAERTDILFVGSWLLRKGILDIVPAVSRALEAHSCLRFTAAGCGPIEKQVIESFAPPLRARIQVIPSLTGNQELIDVYARHAVFLLPSYFEGQPLVMMEAAALGLAIVSANIGGITDFIANGHNGLLAAPGDSDALTACLLQVTSNPELAAKLGANARRKVQEYTWAAAALKIERAYAQAVANPRLFR